MKEDLQKIDQKLDKLDDRLDAVDKHLAVYNEQLEYHIKRTNLLEQDLAPIKKHVIQVQGITKFLIGAIGLTTAIIGILKYLGN